MSQLFEDFKSNLQTLLDLFQKHDELNESIESEAQDLELRFEDLDDAEKLEAERLMEEAGLDTDAYNMSFSD